MESVMDKGVDDTKVPGGSNNTEVVLTLLQLSKGSAIMGANQIEWIVPSSCSHIFKELGGPSLIIRPCDRMTLDKLVVPVSRYHSVVFVTTGLSHKNDDTPNESDQIYTLIQELFHKIENINIPVYYIEKIGENSFQECNAFLDVKFQTFWKEIKYDEESPMSGVSVGGIATIIGWYHMRKENEGLVECLLLLMSILRRPCRYIQLNQTTDKEEYITSLMINEYIFSIVVSFISNFIKK